MSVENTSTEAVTDVKVENESDDEVESYKDLYAGHVIKEEMVIGPVVLQPVVYTAYRPEDVPVPKKPKLETTDEETDQVKPEQGMKKDNASTNFEINTTSRNTKKTNHKCNQTPGLSENVFICNECGKQFRKKYKVAQHVINNKFHSSNNLSRHVRIHTGEKPYSCSYCDYKCNRKGTLSIHVRIHTEEPYSCSYCEYKCYQKCDLSKHVRTHTGEKPYSCSYCDYKCNQKGDLSRHVRVHTGEKPYSCSYCDYKCNQKGDLLRHVRIHTGEKPYSCSYCGYKCNRKGTLSIHVRIHTGEEPYSCSYCEYKSARKSSLSKHLVRIHAGEISK